MTETSAKIICDSISPAGHRLVTFQCVYPRNILAEVNTHRSLSRVSASSRAIPVEKMIKRVMENPYVPTHWGKNQRGMSAEEDLHPTDARHAKNFWLLARNEAVKFAKEILDIGVHKQITNRLLEPFMWHPTLIAGTEWSNFFNLRDHKAAHPDFRDLAHAMQELYGKSEPKLLGYGQWHLPYWGTDEDIEAGSSLEDMKKISVGRCARVSTLTHEGRRDLQADIDLHDKMMAAGHTSPYEFVARPMTKDELEIFKQKKMRWDLESKTWVWVGAKEVYNDEDNTTTILPGEYTHFLGNVQGWVALRKQIPFEEDILGARS
jgi:hypothetical protein